MKSHDVYTYMLMVATQGGLIMCWDRAVSKADRSLLAWSSHSTRRPGVLDRGTQHTDLEERAGSRTQFLTYPTQCSGNSAGLLGQQFGAQIM